ncbi:MAG: inositol monophosphatase [Acidobacteriota bacterium]|nr:inositol monophosphatase [Acidobacteriota bacterium]
MDHIDKFAEAGEAVAREAGALLLGKFRTRIAVERKSAIDLVTEADVAAEKLIVSRLGQAFPAHAVLAEEGHGNAAGGAIRWIVDPLDGTTNYAHGYPWFAVSIAVEVDGEVEWGAVYHPVGDELFTARRGAGAWCNQAPLRVSATATLDDSLLVTGFPYDIRTSPRKNLAAYAAFAVRTQGVRRSGSAALDLCQVAAGRLDGFWERQLKPWDCAAGYLAVREAGGRVTDYAGGRGSVYGGEALASNGLIHGEMMAVLAQVRE